MQIEDKKALRKLYKEIRSNMPSGVRKNADDAIAGNFLSLEDYINCKEILLYVSSEIEVSTSKIMQKALCEKKVYCPRCVPGTNTMVFCRVETLSQLRKGAFGIPEPMNECKICNKFSENALCVIPGLSFDKRGYRLGFGKGYYDRFLVGFSGRKIGLCYDKCLSQALPNDDFDIAADKLVTETMCVNFQFSGKDDNFNER